MMTKFIEMNLFLQDKDPMPENGREEDFIAVQWIMAFILDGTNEWYYPQRRKMS